MPTSAALLAQNDTPDSHLTQQFATSQPNELAILTPSPAVSSCHPQPPNPESTQQPTCTVCDQKINELYYMVASGNTWQQWHVHCLRCSVCNEALTEGTCFWKANNIYCRFDYQRLFRRCAGCQEEILPSDMIMPVVDRNDCMGRFSCFLYHTKCFQCALCHRHLERGSQFFTQGSNVYCEQHFDICTSSSPMLLQMTPLANPEHYQFFNSTDIEVESHQKNRRPSKSSKSKMKSISKSQQSQPLSPLQQQVPMMINSSPSKVLDEGPNVPMFSPLPTDLHRHGCLSTVPGEISFNDPNSEYYQPDYADTQNARIMQSGPASQQSGGSNQSSNGSQQRGKRIRTSFKHTQLKIMKQYFNENHNPDAKDLKELALKTGLSKRVLQVWFQNARAKYRRSMMKEQEKGGRGLLPIDFDKRLLQPSQGNITSGNNSPTGEAMTGSGSMTMDDDCVDDIDDGFQDADELELRSRSRQEESPMLGHHHPNQMQMTPPGFMFMDATQPNNGHGFPSQIIHGSMI